MKTIYADRKGIERKWYLIDARDKGIGRVAARVATILMGKHKPYYAPHQEVGDYVVIINSKNMRLSEKKLQNKMYRHHSGYPGSLKSWNLSKALERNPIYPLEHAIRGMLPKSRLGRKIFKNVKIYAGMVHPHGVQKPEPLSL